MRPKVLLAALIAVATMAAAPAAHAKSIELSVLSSRADQVSGGDALIRVDAPPGLLNKLAREAQRHRRDRCVPPRGQSPRRARQRPPARQQRADRHARTASPRRLRRRGSDSPTTRTPGRCSRARTRSSSSATRSRPGSASRSSTTSRARASGCRTPTARTAGYSVNCSANTQVDYQYRTTGGSFAAAAERRLAPGRHGADDPARRPHRRLRRAARARHDQPLHLLVRDARPVRRAARRRPRHLALEPPPDLHLRRRRSDRPPPGNSQRQRLAVRHRAAQGLRDRALLGHAHEHALQPRARRRDRADDEGGVRRALRRAALHGRRGRLRRRDPAVRLRAEPPGPDRRGHPAVLVPRHGHADDPRRRLRAARELHGQHGRHAIRSGRTGTTASGSRASTRTPTCPTPTGSERPATPSA